MESGTKFAPALFYAHIGATRKEENALRQDLVRGLKDYFEAAYGYDKYGAETIFMLPERMHEPYIYGFALLRILRDRRISVPTKVHAARHSLDILRYGEDSGLPFGLLAALSFLGEHGELEVPDLRYALVVSAGDPDPFRGTDKTWMLGFFRWLLVNVDVPAAERLFWAHSLIARHGEQPGGADLIDALMTCEELPRASRIELCQAWIHFRQPRLAVDMPASGDGARSTLVSEHMPFWVAHAPSWSSSSMMRLGIVWLARLGVDLAELIEAYLGYVETHADQVHGALVEVLAEHHQTLPEHLVKQFIERGIALAGSGATRRKFYRLGADLYGLEYLQRANVDTSGSVRQWAARQLQKLG